MKFSLIIPTQNRASTLSRTLEHLVSSLKGDHRTEIIVVDNNSTDHTRQVVEGYFQQSARVRYLLEETPGLLAGRHAGWNAAEGDILVFLDDDVFVSATMIDAYQEVFEAADVGLAGGNNWPLFETKPPEWLETIWNDTRNGMQMFPELSILGMPHKEPVAHDPFLVWGCSFAVRRTTLEGARGFHPDGVPEALIKFRGDGETHIATYVQDSGLSTIFHPGASVQHWIPSGRMTIEYMKRRAFANGVSSSYTHLRAKHFKKRSPLSHGFRLFAEPIRRVSKEFLNFSGRGCPSTEPATKPPDTADIREIIRFYAAEGRRYHRREFEADRRVRKWVLRLDYIGKENPLVS